MRIVFMNTSLNAKKGVALITTLVMLTILICIVVDILYKTEITSEIAINMRDELKAGRLADSALGYAMVFLKLDMELQNQVSSQISSLLSGSGLGGIKLGDIDPASMHVWDMIPISYPPQIAALLGGGEENVEESKIETEEDDEGFSVEIEDESVKININAFFDEQQQFNAEKKSVTLNMLKNILHLKELDEHFKDDSPHLRDEIAYNTMDWVDSDYESGDPRRGGDENREYYKNNPPYEAKNKKFDSLPELLMVGEMRDEIYKVISPYITVFGDTKINVKGASKEIISSLLSDDIQDKEKKAEEIIAKRADAGITAQNFISNISKALNYSKPEELFMKELVKDQSKYISDKSTKFTVKATGHAGKISRTIIAVCDRGRDMNSEIITFYRRIY